LFLHFTMLLQKNDVVLNLWIAGGALMV